MDAFTGEIRIFPYNYIPQDWLPCWGQSLPVGGSYTQLFSIIGNKYGGDGKANFHLPNLSNKIAIGSGSGPGLTPRTVAQSVGSNSVMLSSANLAPHSHMINARNSGGGPTAVNAPDGNVFLSQPRGVTTYNPAATAGMTLAPTTIGNGGNVKPTSAERSTVQPVLGLTYCICISGDVYPVKP